MSTRRFTRARPRTPMQWIPCGSWDSATAATSVGGKTKTVLVDAAAGFSGTTSPQPQIARMTVLRIRGRLIVSSADVAATQQVRWGIAVVPQSLAVANMPDPGAQASADYDWLTLGQTMSGISGSVFANSANADPLSGWIDVKSKRRLEPDHQLVFITSATGLSSSGVTFGLFLRTLIGRVA